MQAVDAAHSAQAAMASKLLHKLTHKKKEDEEPAPAPYVCMMGV